LVGGTYVSLFIKDLENNETTSSLNLSNVRSSLLSESINEGDEGESVVSSISDLSITSKKPRWTGKHNRSECLQCCRSKINRLQSRTESQASVVRRKMHQLMETDQGVYDASFNSPGESVFSEDNVTDRVTENILRHVQRMANPVWSKMSKMALLELKQKHPQSFQDICLYSEVCKALGRNTYRILARRFLQEIFLDLDFDSFYNEANEIMERHEVVDESIMIIEKNVDDRAGGGNNNTDEIQIKMQAALTLAMYKMKSPPLASLYETSIENLSESLNSKSNKLNLVSHSMKQQNQQNNFNLQTLPTQNINNNSRHYIKTSSSNSDNSEVSSVVSVAAAGTTTVTTSFRPRLHTFELDLSCTKNKFPIRDRSKIVSPTSSTLFPQLSGSMLPSPTDPYQQQQQQQQQQESTKSLSSSSLYCERRLLSKSEATLMKK
jgi:rapamycin-insensitive companion of mTOR